MGHGVLLFRAFNTANAHVAPKCGLQVEEVKLGRGKGKVKKKSAGDDDEEDAVGWHADIRIDHA